MGIESIYYGQQVVAAQIGEKLFVTLGPAAVARLQAATGYGVATVIFDTMRSTTRFAQGEIGDKELAVELAGAGFKGATVAGGTMVTLMLVSNPAGWAVVAVGIGSYIASDVVFDAVREECLPGRLTDSDLAGWLPADTRKGYSIKDYWEDRSRRAQQSQAQR